MNNELKKDLTILTKEFENNNVGIVLNEKGEPLFELYSTGMALGQVKESKGKIYPRKDRIDQNLRNADISTVVHNGQQYLSEEMLYDFMLEAKTDKCKVFRKWVTNEVLPSIRKNGAYVSNNITEEQEDKLDKYSTTRKIKNTFKTCSIESIDDTYKECMIYNKNKDGNEKKTIQKNILTALEDRKTEALENNKGAIALVISESINLIKKKLLETCNKSNGQKIRFLNEDINELNEEVILLKEQIINSNPPLEEYMQIDCHGMSNNSLYRKTIDRWTNEEITVKTDSYKKWIEKFPSHQLKPKDELNIDWKKPIVIFFKFDCIKSFDVQNLVKSAIDEIITRNYKEDDNIVYKVITERNKIVNSYSEGKIYVYIKNA